MTISEKYYGNTAGSEITLYTFTTKSGNSISIINYGAIITSWIVKDKHNTEKNIVAGFSSLEGYINDDSYLGSIAGRYANRIANGKFSINETFYQLACNDNGNHLHGGDIGFNKRIWKAEPDHENGTLSLKYFSRDGEENYPGNLEVTVKYFYNDADELTISYDATTDKATALNLTSHSYFNLSGDISRRILTHNLTIHADHYTPVNEQIPTGEIRAVAGTGFDFREAASISDNVKKAGGAIDHNFVLNKAGHEFSLAASLTDDENLLELSVFTTQPGMQLYTGNMLDGSLINRDNKLIQKHCALCLETQHFPDSPNHSNFPSTILSPGEHFTSKTMYRITAI